jgi:uncharacterized protein YeeX (DUF496 family)
MKIAVTDLAKELDGVVGDRAIKMQIHRGNLKATKHADGKLYVDDTQPVIQEWRLKKTEQQPDTQLKEEVIKLRRENALLSKRVRQAEAKAERAERKRVRTLEQLAQINTKVMSVTEIVAAHTLKALTQEDVKAEVVGDEEN